MWLSQSVRNPHSNSNSNSNTPNTLELEQVRQGLLLRGKTSSSSRQHPHWIRALLHVLLVPMIHLNGSEIWFCDACVRGVRARSARISLFLIHLIQRTRSYHLHNFHPRRSFVSLARDNATRMFRKYSTRASRSNTGTCGYHEISQ